jgi:hypothetical protein
VTSAVLSSPCRILDLAITPNGKQLVAVGRGQVTPNRVTTTSSSTGVRNGAVSVAGISGASGTNGRSTTPSTSMPKHEKQFTVFNMETRLVELSVLSAIFVAQ